MFKHTSAVNVKLNVYFWEEFEYFFFYSFADMYTTKLVNAKRRASAPKFDFSQAAL